MGLEQVLLASLWLGLYSSFHTADPSLAGDLPGAIAECSQSPQVLPTPEAYETRGMACSLNGKKDLALANFKAAARGFGSREDFASLDNVVQKLLALEAELAGVGLPAPRSWQFPEVIEAARSVSPRNLEGRLFDGSRWGWAIIIESVLA